MRPDMSVNQTLPPSDSTPIVRARLHIRETGVPDVLALVRAWMARRRRDLDEQRDRHGAGGAYRDQQAFHLTAPYTLAPNVAGATTELKIPSAFCKGSEAELAT
jgi:hypothetical protein